MSEKAENGADLISSPIDDNINTWKKLADCKLRFQAAEKAVAWVRLNGNYSENQSSPKSFKVAMSIDQSKNLEAAFNSAVMVGIVCQESSFGTRFDNAREYKGPFQMAKIVITEYNSNNQSNLVVFPSDIDDLANLDKAAQVASWYYTMNLQRLTKKSELLNPVTDVSEARKFALASYNGGPTVIKKARELTPGGSETWDKVKLKLEAAGVDPDKAKEIRDYVDLVLAYAAKSSNCWCTVTDNKNIESDSAPTVSNSQDFHIGLTMAGAVSAGCYTAGVMDYLFEILELWQNAKDGKLPAGWNPEILQYVPKHNVIIDAMGGSSAGGMTTIMSAIYALKGEISPVRSAQDQASPKQNLLYDSWVLMNDKVNDPVKLFEKSLDASDLKESIPSLLNSEFIDVICDTVFANIQQNALKRPNYISERLEVVLSQTMLRSVPLAIDFTTGFGNVRISEGNPEHNTFDHFLINHFKLDYDNKNPQHVDFYLPLNFENAEDIERLKLATKATGAFPIGLKFREFFNGELSSEYIKNNSKKILFDSLDPTKIPSDPPIRWRKDFPDPFQFVGVDAGTINNEPFGEILNILKERYGKKEVGDYDKFALIMIDPFPDIQPEKKYKQPNDIFSVVPSIIGTLWNQSKVKRKEMLEFYHRDYYRGEIFPKRYPQDTGLSKPKPEKYAIACGSAYAFGGFLDINFRHHDFFLGRDNARNFFRSYFSFEYNPEPTEKPADGSTPVKYTAHPIHSQWTKEMINKFKFTRDNRTFLPIIPDLYKLKEKLEGTGSGPFTHTVPNWPIYNPDHLLKLAPKLEARIEKMMDLAIDKIENAQRDEHHPITKRIIDKHYHERLFKRIKGWIGAKFLKFLYKSNKGTIAAKASRATINWMFKDLEDRKLIK